MAERVVEDRTPASRLANLGAVPALLLAMSGVYVAVAIAARAATQQDPVLDAGILVYQLTSAASFALAATILLGIDRWPTGRAWLIAGVAALVVQGLLELALQAWFWWAFSGGSERLIGLDQTWLRVRSVAALLAGAAGFALPAIGLLAAPPASAVSRARRRAAAGIGLLGLLALSANLALAREVGVRSAASPVDLFYALVGLGAAALAALGAAATHRLPAHYRMPELLIGGGAALAVGNAAWQAMVTLGWMLQDYPGGIGWLQVLPNWIGLAGLLAVILGFASARIVPPRNSWQRGEQRADPAPRYQPQ